MEIWQYLMLPAIGFVIGYFTNYLAIKMIFHPRRKILGIQGILPKRKKVLAKNVSEVVVELLPENIRKLEELPFVGKGIFEMVRSEIEHEVGKMKDEDLEYLVLKVVHRELSFITWIGGALGFVIGLVQVGILMV